MFSSHLESWEMMGPRQRRDSTVLTQESHRVMVSGAAFFLGSPTIPTGFTALCSELFSPHQVTR